MRAGGVAGHAGPLQDTVKDLGFYSVRDGHQLESLGSGLNVTQI